MAEMEQSSSVHDDRLQALHRRQPDPDALSAAGKELQIAWPADYIAFMQSTDGADGWIGKSYVDLWSAADLIDRNRRYQVEEFAPTLVIFGSDGAGEAFAFNRSTDPPTIVIVPFVGLDEPISQGPSFADLIARLHAGRLFE